ncbi:MAG: glycosyltransferase [Bacteroidota bacterium]
MRSSGIGTIHAWCTPGGILGYLLSILSGKRLVLDSFEPHAEVMLETGTWKAGSLKFKILFFFEKIMSRHADIHICCTSDMIEYSRKKYGTVINISFTKPACVDLDKFHPSKRKNIQLLSDLGLEGRIVAVYAGKFGGLYLEQECFDFFKAAIDHWGDRFRVLLLTPVSPEIIHTMSQIAGLSDHVIVQRFVPHEDVPILMGLGDFGFAPYRPVPSRKYSAPIKVSEYMAMGLPIVITENIADDSQLIETEGIGAVIKSLDNAGYLSVIHRLDELLKDPEISTKARHKAETLRNFGIAINIYESIYQD